MKKSDLVTESETEYPKECVGKFAGIEIKVFCTGTETEEETDKEYPIGYAVLTGEDRYGGKIKETQIGGKKSPIRLEAKYILNTMYDRVNKRKGFRVLWNDLVEIGKVGFKPYDPHCLDK